VTYNARNDEKEGSCDFDEVVYGLAGTLATAVEGQKHEITAGHSVFVPRRTVTISTRTFI
jgi:quercetin dioxygenase-like cupin family protein